MSGTASEGTILTPGNHDGVHLGHRALLRTARELATDGLDVVALTFDPHPAQLLAPERAPALITELERRCALLRRAGADRVEVLAFDEALASMSPDEFVNDVLVDRMRARGVVVGPDFRFGKDREGDVTRLAKLGGAHGFVVRVEEPVVVRGAPVSSTRVRTALTDGDIDLATALLGRVHELEGTVVRGQQRGRTIGVPTANLAPPAVLAPADGVYAVVARVVGDGAVLSGVANLGVRPTVEAGRSIEVHLFDFDGDLYGSTLRVGFVTRLRGERRFDGLAALKEQIARDMDDARERLARAQPETWSWI